MPKFRRRAVEYLDPEGPAAHPDAPPYVPDESTLGGAVAVLRANGATRSTAASLSRDEARFITSDYYRWQGERLRAEARVLACKTNAVETGVEELHGAIAFLAEQAGQMEANARAFLDVFSAADLCGKWMRSIVGIGPVIAAGLLAHLDVEKAPTAGNFWSFAGLTPTAVWEKGKRRPWNAALKVIAVYKAGEAFVRTQNHPGSYYGPIFRRRKDEEKVRNEAGLYAAKSAEILAAKNYRTSTVTYAHYAAGHLSPAHIHARARRYTAKLFLAHVHEVMYFLRYKTLPPPPYAIAHAGHVHYIPPPNPKMVKGLLTALRERGPVVWPEWAPDQTEGVPE